MTDGALNFLGRTALAIRRTKGSLWASSFLLFFFFCVYALYVDSLQRNWKSRGVPSSWAAGIMSRSHYQCLVVGLEVVLDLGVQLVGTSPPPRPNPDGDVHSLRSCSPTFVRFALLVP